IGLVLTVVKLVLDSDHPLLVSMTLTLVVAGFLHLYAKTLSIAEHARQYGRMSLFFDIAEQRARAWLDAGQTAQFQALTRELGQEALAENGAWVLLHRERRPEQVVHTR